MGKKNITINDVAKSLDDLARMFKEGFAMINIHFDRIDKQFGCIEAHLDRMERNQEIILSKLDGECRCNITN